MQLKRLVRTAAATGTYLNVLNGSKEVSVPQNLQELEDVDPAINDAASDPALNAAPAPAAAAAAAAAAQRANASHITPKSGTFRASKASTGLTSSAKRQRREFKSLFDEQEFGAQQQHANLNDGITQQGQDNVDDVDLVTPPWLQQTTPPASAARTHRTCTTSTSAGADLGPGGWEAAGDANNAQVPAAALGSTSGWRLSKAAARTPAPQHQHGQQQCWSTSGVGPGSGHKQQQQQQPEDIGTVIQQQQQHQQQQQRAQSASPPNGADAAQLQRQPQQQGRQHVADEQEDAICDASDDDGAGFNHAPGSAAADVQHVAARGVQLPALLLTSPRSDGKVSRQRQLQQGRRSLPIAMHGPAMGQYTPVDIASDGLQGSEGEQPWHQQQQQQDARFTAGRQLPVPPRMDSSLVPAATAVNGVKGKTSLQVDNDAAMWEPPKNRRQQQQQQIHISVSRPPAAPMVQQASTSGYAAAAADAGLMGGYNGGTDGAASRGGGAAAAGDVGSAPEELPWWTVLEDFVPVEVLVQSLVNPRDNSVVHINYKSQFKDGGAAGKRASTAGTATNSSRRKATGSTRGRKGAAAKAAAGTALTTAGANVLGSLQGGRKGIRKGSSGGRKSSKRSGSGRRRGSGSGRGSGAGSGGQKKQRRRRTGRWSFINGQKVFIDHSGQQLTGSAAYMQWKATNG